jgi:hypothetical protein
MKYKTGKIKDAQCPICGEFMKMETVLTSDGKLRIWFCVNLNHGETLMRISVKKSIKTWHSWFK